METTPGTTHRTVRGRTVGTRLLLVAALLLAVGGGTAAAARSGGPGPGTAAPIDRATASTRIGSSGPGGQAHYVAIDPCRIVDTRNAGGKVAAGTTRNFFAVGAFPGQGAGSPCGIPFGVVAVEATVTAVDADGNGFLRVWPYGSTPPNATYLNYTGGFNVANTGAIAVNTAGSFDITVKAFTKATHLVIDVQGYYAKPIFLKVSAAGTATSGYGAGAAKTSEGTYKVTFDQDVTGCAVTASATIAGYVAAVQPVGGDGSSVYVTIQQGGGYVDDAFSLIAAC